MIRVYHKTNTESIRNVIKKPVECHISNSVSRMTFGTIKPITSPIDGAFVLWYSIATKRNETDKQNKFQLADCSWYKPDNATTAPLPKISPVVVGEVVEIVVKPARKPRRPRKPTKKYNAINAPSWHEVSNVQPVYTPGW